MLLAESAQLRCGLTRHVPAAPHHGVHEAKVPKPSSDAAAKPAAGHRGLVDAHEAAQEVQHRVMVLFQLLEEVLITLRDSHSLADLSGMSPDSC